MISKGKEYRTIDGNEVRIYATGCGGRCPVHGAILSPDCKEWISCAWTSDGRDWNVEGLMGASLIEVKPRIKRTVWLNVYRSGDAMVSAHDTIDRAKSASRHEIAARIPIEIDCEEGDGLND